MIALLRFRMIYRRDGDIGHETIFIYAANREKALEAFHRRFDADSFTFLWGKEEI